MTNSTNDLTQKQAKVLTFICNYFKENKFYPTYKDIAKTFQFNSDATVRTYLEILERKKYIKRHAKARALTILKNPFETPIIGNIKAGIPSEALETFDTTVDTLDLLTYSKNKFGLKVKGDSMINAGIFENDIAIIQKNKTITSNDIVAALIDDEATLKRYVKEDQKIILKAENSNYNPIILSENTAPTLIGKCIGIIREY